ncbi:hypothetical protein HDR66_01070 [bacterium]|nr:hypothetical protein [bacterium]
MATNVIVTITLCILSILFPKSKIVCLSFFAFMWTLWGFNMWNGDYIAYMLEYQYPEWDTIEIGYRALCSLFSSWLPYQKFLMVVSGIILSTFCYWGVKHTKYPAFFALIYFPMFIMEFVYLRNYIALTLLFFATFRLIYKNGNLLVSLFLVLLATTVHVFSICYFPVILLLKYNINYKYLLALLTIGTVMILTLNQFVFQNSSYIASKVYYYTQEGSNRISLTTPFHCIVVLICYYTYKNTELMTLKSDIILKRYVNFNILSLILVPIYIILPFTASRSLRILLVIDMFFYLNLFYNSLARTRIFSILGLLFILASVGYIFTGQTFNYVLAPLYHCNLIWGYDPNYQLFFTR